MAAQRVPAGEWWLLRLSMDSQATVALLSKGYSTASVRGHAALRVVQQASLRGLDVVAAWAPREQNAVADALSHPSVAGPAGLPGRVQDSLLGAGNRDAVQRLLGTPPRPWRTLPTLP